jgi:hypothetical protein
MRSCTLQGPRASVANSWTVFAGTDGWSKSTDGEREMMLIGTKFLSAS